MATYTKPKKRLHRDFVYLQHESVINSLSAFEAGKVDEIIQKTAEATDRGFEAGVARGPIKAGGRKKQKEMQEELVRTRTWFSAFEQWYQAIRSAEALGKLEGWDDDVRDELEVGDTLEVVGDVRLSPLHMLFATFESFARDANAPHSIFQFSTKELAEFKRTAKMMEHWASGPGGRRSSVVYIVPASSEGTGPRLVGRLEEEYVIGGLDRLHGRFQIVAQVEAVLTGEDQMSAIRILRDVPPTPLELKALGEGLEPFKGEVAKEMGIPLTNDDITFRHPAVIVRPLAIFR